MFSVVPPASWSRLLAILLALATTAAPRAQGAECTPKPAGLATWWRGDSGPWDWAGTNHASLQNGAWVVDNGKVGRALRFDGVDDFALVSEPADLLTSPTAFTFEAWIRPTGPGSDAHDGGTVIGRESSYLIARFADGSIAWAFANSSPSFSWVDTGFDAPLSAWTHLAVVYDGGQIRTYANGAWVHTYAGAGAVATGWDHLLLGARAGDRQCFNGLIDEASLYRRALTGAEIAAIYQADSAGKCVDPAPPTLVLQPENASVREGLTARFDSAALGLDPLRCQWQFQGSNLAQATNASLVLANVTTNQSGMYRVMVSNACGSVTSVVATLTVAPLDEFTIAVGDRVSLGVPGSGAGNLETPLAEDLYQFEGTAGTRVYFDDQGWNLGYWTLRAPDGTVLFHDPLDLQDPGLLLLHQDGTYTIVVQSYGQPENVGPYAFQLWRVPQPTPFAIRVGDQVYDSVPAAGAGRLAVPGEIDLYTFTGTVGQQVFFDDRGGYLGVWTVVNPDGTELFRDDLDNRDPGVMWLPATGTYTVAVAGYGYSENIGPYAFAILPTAQTLTFPIQIGDGVSDGVPAAGAGRLSVPGEVDQYTFVAQAGQRVFFDDCGGRIGYWEVSAPNGDQLFRDDLDTSDPGTRTLPADGTYLIRVYGYSGSQYVGAYSFKLSAVPNSVTYSIAIGNTVSDGVPAAGAGRFAAPGEEDLFTFAGTAGQWVYFDDQGGGVGYWALLGPDGNPLFRDDLDQSDPGAILLPITGTYTLRVRSHGGSQHIGPYAFRLLLMSEPGEFTLTLGSEVRDGVPQTGAGRLDTPGGQAEYHFAGTAGQRVFFEDGGASFYAQWLLFDPAGVCLFQDTLDGSDPMVKRLPVTGTYTLRVQSAGDASQQTGTYAFRFTAVPDPVTYNLALGNVVSEGVPAAGAGLIAAPGEEDGFTFTGTAGQTISFEDRGGHGQTWSIVDPRGLRLSREALDGNPATQPIVLPVTGTYALFVGGHDPAEAIGSYSFALVVQGAGEIPTSVLQTFAIAIGDTVANGTPGPGAGNLHTSTALDVYSFTASPAQTLFFAALNTASTSYWQLLDETGLEVFTEWMPSQNVGRRTLDRGGTYRLLVYPYAGLTGNYSFQITTVRDDQFTVAVGDTVADGAPAAGAGRLEYAGSQDVYLLNNPTDQALFFEDLGAARCCLDWELRDPHNTIIFNNRLDDTDPGRYHLEPGIHTLTVRSAGADPTWAGTYSFRIRSIRDDRFTIAIGDTVSEGYPAQGAANLENPGAYDTYSFTSASNQVVYFEDIRVERCCLNWQLFDAAGNTLFLDLLDGNDPGRFALGPGTHTIIVHPAGTDPGWSGCDHCHPPIALQGRGSVGLAGSDVTWTGSYAFRLHAVRDDRFPIEVGQTIAPNQPAAGAGNLESSGCYDLYTLVLVTPQLLYFQDLDAQNGCLNWAVFDQNGNRVFEDRLDGVDAGRFDLNPGRYTVYAYPASSDSTAVGTYSFRIRSLEDTVFHVAIGDTISRDVPGTGAGWIETPGTADVYVFTCSVPQVVCFQDIGASACCLNWALYDFVGNRLFEDRLDGWDAGRFSLNPGGYFVRVYPAGSDPTWVGTYGFRLAPVEDDQFEIAIGDTVAAGIPGPGAGVVETQGSRDTYLFQAAQGERVFFADGGGPGGLSWRLTDDVGNPLFDDSLGGASPGTIVLTRGGTYTLTVYSSAANATGTGSYAFQLWPSLPMITGHPQDYRGLVGQDLTLEIQAQTLFTPLLYQWRFNGVPLAGAESAWLTLTHPTAANAGTYDVLVSNPYGTVTSRVATVTLDSSLLFITEFSPSGTVPSPVSSLRLQFNEPVDASSITIADLVLTGPDGPVNLSGASLTPVDDRTFQLSFAAQTRPGAYDVIVGPGIRNAGGAAMTPGVFSPLYRTDFESGSGGEWSRADSLSSTLASRFLCEFDNQTVFLVRSGLPPHTELRLMWDLVVLDSWDGINGPDWFGVTLAGLATPLWEHTFHSSGSQAYQSYQQAPDLNGVNLAGLSDYTDSLYRDVTLDFPHEDGDLDLGFYGRNLEGVLNEGWGIDNVRLLNRSDDNGAYHTRFVIDSTPPTVLGLSLTGTNTLPVTTLDITFSEPIQPQSLTVTDLQFTSPLGPVLLTSLERVDATHFRITFPAQRANGGYHLAVGPGLLDLAGLAMATAATNRFVVLTPPVITSQPTAQTVVRNHDVVLQVVAQATEPVQYQWQFNSADIPGATQPTLTITQAQTNQSGLYRVVVTDAGGSVASTEAAVTVLYSHGLWIGQAQATRASLPAVPGNGVAIELFNGIGGGAAPSPDNLVGRTPSGTTLSPLIDFPSPGTTVAVGSRFATFFENTATPPAQVQDLAALNFILHHQFHLRVARPLDRHPDTPEIDLLIGVGSDDGFHLTVGSNLIGSSGDRSFSYSWRELSFEEEGLYPVTLLYAANATDQSGLEFAWQAGPQDLIEIVPQTALYITPDLGDRLITFEELPPNTVVEDQYRSQGVRFQTHSGALQITTKAPAKFVAVSPTHVFGDPASPAAHPGELELQFVLPGSSEPATTDFASLFVIDAESVGATVSAFDNAGQTLFSQTCHGGGGAQELVSISQRGIARLRIHLGEGTDTAAIDNLAFLTPVSFPDLAVTDLQVPAIADAGQPVDLVWRVLNQGTHSAEGTWTDTLYLSEDPAAGNDTVLTSITFTQTLPAGASLTVTQRVIVPFGVAGDHWFIVTTDSAAQIAESGSAANNTRVAAQSTQVLAPDLVATSLSAPTPCYFGSPIPVTWVVQNAGTAPAAHEWLDTLHLTTASNDYGNAILLGSVSVTRPLVPGERYTNTLNVPIPLRTWLTPGTYFLTLGTDASSTLAELDEANNVRTMPVQLTSPPLPDLAVTTVRAPATVSVGIPFPIVWGITNQGTATASGIWEESISLSTDPLPGGDLYLASFEFNNNLAPGAWLWRTQEITLPTDGLAGALYLAVETDRTRRVVETDEQNNVALAQSATAVPVQLTLALGATSVPENAATPQVLCTVSRNGLLNTNLVVQLSSSDATELTVPSTVTLFAAQATTGFNATVQPDGLFDDDQTVHIQAAAPGYAGAAATLVVVNADAPVLTLSLDPADLVEGSSTRATVRRPSASPAALQIDVSNPAPSQLAMPASVTLEPSQLAAGFDITALDDTLLESTRTFTLTATADRYNPVSAALTVRDNDVPNLTITLVPPTLSEGAGPNATTGTVLRDRNSPQSVVIALQSSNPAAALVPATVTIPAGQTQAAFVVSAVDDTQVDGTQTTVIRGWALDSLSGEPLRESNPASLQVTDDDGPTLTLTLDTNVAGEGLSTTATLARNTDPTSPLAVSLLSSDPTEAAVPNHVILPAGSATTTFAVSTFDDGVTDGSQNVVLSASANGFTGASALLVVTDGDQPDLTVHDVSGPASVLADESFNLQFRIENRGRTATSQPITQRVFLSPDPQIGDDTLLRQVEFSGTLAPGASFTQTLQVQAPQRVGTNWVVVVADVLGQQPELLENNNAGLGSAPIQILPAYVATVVADLHQAAANTPVPLHGQATRTLDGGPAAFELVTIHIEVRGTRRTCSALTRSDGTFAAQFQPLPGEAGVYNVAAAHPGIENPPAQDTFTLFGLRITAAGPLSIIEGASLTHSTRVHNLSTVPLTGLTASVVSSPAGLTVTPSLSASAIPGDGTVNLDFRITCPAGVTQDGTARIRVAAAEGVSADLDLTCNIQTLRPQLAFTPASLATGMRRGTQTSVALAVTNTGGLASGSLTLALPPVSWLASASGGTVDSLAPGQGTVLTLLLTPPEDLPLGPYSGSLILSGDQGSATVPFNFVCLSEAKGGLQITTVDEYTYYAEGSPRVTNATVRITDAVTGTLVLTTQSDAAGEVRLPDLTESFYHIEASAPEHGDYRGTVLVRTGETAETLAFLPRHTVQYFWTVEPAGIEDRTLITIETVFETVVPIPVVTLEPNVIDLADMTTPEMQVDLKITNHGLIAAQNARLYFGSHPDYTFTPLITDLGPLPARSSFTVPLLVRRGQGHANLHSGGKHSENGQCNVSGGLLWELVCGPHTNLYDVPIAIANAGDDCGFVVSWGPPHVVGGGGFTRGDGGAVIVGPSFGSVPNLCDPCNFRKLEAILKCIVDFLPLPGSVACVKGVWDCAHTLAAGPDWVDIGSCLVTIAECLGKDVPVLGQVLTGISCYTDYEDACVGLPGHEGQVQLQRHVSGHAAGATDASGSVKKQLDRLSAIAAPLQNVFGAAVWFDCRDSATWSNWISGFITRVEPSSPDGLKLSDAERAGLLALPRCDPITQDDVNRFLDRWNRSLEYSQQGILQIADVPSGWSPDFIAFDVWLDLVRQANNAALALEAEGYSDPIEAVQAEHSILASRLGTDSGGVCARVRLRVEQEAVITRDAFKATLEIVNSTHGPLEDIAVEIAVSDDAGQTTTGLFGFRAPELSGLTAVDGTGRMESEATGKATWVLVPTSEAAPTATVDHFVHGTLRYRQNDVLLTVPLAPTVIHVLPNPRLVVRCFHERAVYSDDPFTDEIEPSVPCSLAVMVQNQGFGTARNLRIASAQPKIIENDKGLPIDFQIVAAEVAGQSIQPSLTVDLGDLEPQQTAIGRWLLTSSLQGLFTEYTATFKHLDDLGDARLSLIERVDLHEIIHLVQADRPFDDGHPDFLVNDIGDVNDDPDTLWFSTGSNAPVQMVTAATLDGPAATGHLSVQLTADMPAGWACLRLPDPANGLFLLRQVRRADQSLLALDQNAWVTDRTSLGLGQRPIHQCVLRMLDYHSAATRTTYTLDYDLIPALTDFTPPSSAVHALPARNPTTFALQWSAQDEAGGSGLAKVEIFVSDNGSPFARWLIARGPGASVFTGEVGHAYSFYSVATDLAQNREAAPGVPDTATTADLVNSPPSLTMPPDQVVNEGATLSVDPVATDTDSPPQTLAWTLAPGAPPGASVDAATGRLTWPTGEGNGPGTLTLTVLVTDNGVPPLSATGDLRIIVREVNSAPILVVGPDQKINEGRLLVITNQALDLDLPANTIRFALDASAPSDATVDPLTGVLSWRPGELQGPSTNQIPVIATDDGTPPLSTTNIVQVIVRDVLSDFVLTFGSTNVLAGEVNSVPIGIRTSLELQRLQFFLAIDPPVLTDLAFQASSTEFLGATVAPAGGNQVAITLDLNAQQGASGQRELARLQFTAPPTLASGVVRLEPSARIALRAEGLLVTNSRAEQGHVIVVRLQPVLWAEQAGESHLVLFGRPGMRYQLEFATELTSATLWEIGTSFLMEDRYTVLPGIEPDLPFVLYRVRQVSP